MRTSAARYGRTEVSSTTGAVAGGDTREAVAGAVVLEEGGNAVDAVVAGAFVAFVVEPQMCGLGGYGQMAVYLQDGHEFWSVEHGVRAPGRATPDMFELEPGGAENYLGAPGVVGRANEIGHLSTGVPGAISGLFAAHERWGCLPWSRLLQPAIDLAEKGLTVSFDLMASITMHAVDLRNHPSLAAKLLRDGLPAVSGDGFHPEGDVIDLSDLADSLRIVAAEGADGFYGGRIAEAIEAEYRRGGGLLDAEDLAAYRSRVTKEVPLSFYGLDCSTGCDSVADEALNILARVELGRFAPDSVQYRHYMAEALACAFTDTLEHYGDPDTTESPVIGLSSPAFGAVRAAMLREERALPRPVQAIDPWPYDGRKRPEVAPVGRSTGGAGGTTKIVAGDRHGNLAALCTTLETGFGSLVLVPGTGIIMNNAMLDFDPRPGRANSVAPGKMALFGAPTVVAARDGEGAFASAGSGGYRIEAAVLHALVNAEVYGMGPQEATDAPRVYCQGGETIVDEEIVAGVVDALARAGHAVVRMPQRPGSVALGRVSAVRRDADSGLVSAGSSPCWCTAAAAAEEVPA